MTLWRNLVVALVAAFALAACSSSSDPEPMAMPEPEPTPEERCTAAGDVWSGGSCISAADDAYNTALAAIAEAETEAQAQAAVNAAVEAGISAAQLRALNAAVTERTDALAAAAAAAQRAMLVAGAMCEAATEECVTAHNLLIAALRGDVNRLAADADATNAQQEAAQEALDAAIEKRDMVQMAMDELDRTTTAGREVGEAMDAARMLETDRSAEAIAAAKAAIEEAEEAVGDDDSYAERIAMAQRYVDRAEERNTVDAAVMAATTAADGLTEDSDAAAVTAAQGLIDAAKMAVADAEHLTDAEKATLNATITSDERLVTLAKNRNDAAAEEKRLADEKADEEEQREANEAMAAMAAKLSTGISAPTGDAGTPGADDRAAAYNNDATAIMVSIGDGTTAPAAPATGLHTLSEDKKTTVAANHGWEGKRYADPAGGDMVEATVYSNVGDPTEGDPFNEEYTLTAAGTTNPGEVAIDQSDTTVHPTSKVASASFDQSAGTKEFKLPTNAVRVMLSGSYHGVSGTYYCTPAASSTCAVQVAADGFTLGGTADADNAFTAGGGTWAFKPSSPTAKVMSTPDANYASYGWWLRKSADDKTYTASAFVDEKGTVADASAITALQGTATYRGGAAGKYALSSSTGGTNDAGHFTARATLEADFGDDMITGTIDQFMGADGMSRPWSVELMESAIGDTGLIRRSDDDNSDLAAADPGAMTTWTIDGMEGTAAGSWTGSLKDNGDDGVPKVGTGTFHSTHGPGNSMVGAFGVNKQ